MDERTEHLLTAQWFLLILPLCIAGMALYPSVMTVFFSGNPQGAAITVFYALVTGLLVVGCIALVRHKETNHLAGQAPYQHPVPTCPAPHQVEVPTPSTSPRHLHIGNPGGTLPPA